MRLDQGWRVALKVPGPTGARGSPGRLAWPDRGRCPRVASTARVARPGPAFGGPVVDEAGTRGWDGDSGRQPTAEAGIGAGCLSGGRGDRRDLTGGAAVGAVESVLSARGHSGAADAGRGQRVGGGNLAGAEGFRAGRCRPGEIEGDLDDRDQADCPALRAGPRASGGAAGSDAAGLRGCSAADLPAGLSVGAGAPGRRSRGGDPRAGRTGRGAARLHDQW